MTRLTAAIERIMNWLQQYQPEFAAAFLPGLTCEQIQEKTKDLPGLLPEEISVDQKLLRSLYCEYLPKWGLQNLSNFKCQCGEDSLVARLDEAQL